MTRPCAGALGSACANAMGRDHLRAAFAVLAPHPRCARVRRRRPPRAYRVRWQERRAGSGRRTTRRRAGGGRFDRRRVPCGQRRRGRRRERRPPVHSRASGSSARTTTTCPASTPHHPPLPDGAPPPPVPCTTTADCSDGGGSFCHGGACTPDQCLSDDDCPAGTACGCGPEVGGGGPDRPNRCITANCRTSADCPSGACQGSSSPASSSTQCDQLLGYFCVTPTDMDTCTSQGCCAPNPAMEECLYQPTLGHWACGTPDLVCFGSGITRPSR